MDQEYLKSILSYDEETGEFTNLVRRGSRGRIGLRAGGNVKVRKKTYRALAIDNKPYLEHRLAFLYMTGEMPKNDVDHIDGNGTNNKWDNLRDVTRRENCRNQRMHSNNTSGLSGVSRGPLGFGWTASINGEFIGLYDEFDEAVAVREAAEIEHNYHENHGSYRPS